MTTLALVRTCTCGAVLSRYNDGDLCAACASRPEPQPRPVDLDFAVLAILSAAHALHPGRSVNVLARLRAKDIEVDCWTLRKAVRRIHRRFGIYAEGVKGRPGYRIVRVEHRFKRVSHVPPEAPEDNPDQLSLDDVLGGWT